MEQPTGTTDQNQNQNQQTGENQTVDTGAEQTIITDATGATDARAAETGNDLSARLQEISQLPAVEQLTAMAELWSTLGIAAQPVLPAHQANATAATVTPIAARASFAELQARSMSPQQEFDALVARKEYLWSQISHLSLHSLTEQSKEIEQIDDRMNAVWNGGKSGIVRKEDKR